MKRILIALFLGTTILAAAEGGPPETPAIRQQTCPVMQGNPINPELFVDDGDRRIYLCCTGCIKPVKEDFEKHWAMVQEGIAKESETEATPAPAHDHGEKAATCCGTGGSCCH